MSDLSPREALRFVFGVHLHQPVGNFDNVFSDHVRDVYRPLIRQFARRHLGPVLLHVSGPLLEWLEHHDTAVLDDIGNLVADGRAELVLAGMYEPILAAIPRADRVEQIQWHREALRARFGAVGDGLWLTERVWTPELAADLADAGVRYVFVDDRHFLVTGYDQADLHVPYRTEHEGRGVTVLAIDQRLRYLIPFRTADHIAAYLRELRDAGKPLAVFADDGEKFGGWPGTADWVYTRGWFDAFCDTIDALRDEGVIRLCTGAEAVEAVPTRGPAYLPTASYSEMEAWALPAAAAARLTQLERHLGEEKMAGPERALVRGSHWHNFLAKYPESNRLHKKTLALSGLSRDRGDPPVARRAIGRAQCNDALWHGVFGGLYLPHLRHALWRELAIAEAYLRDGEQLSVEVSDFDCDGADEIWVHSHAFSAIVAPARGGAIIEYTDFASGRNYADTLTRRLEAYHIAPVHDTHPTDGDEALSIHELARFQGEDRPVVDLDDRALGVARVLAADVTPDAYRAAAYRPLASWARARCQARHSVDKQAVRVACEKDGFAVTWHFTAAGLHAADYSWNAATFPAGASFAPEFSLGHPLSLAADDPRDIWQYDIETVTASERAVERIRQGSSVTPLVDATRGTLRITFG